MTNLGEFERARILQILQLAGSSLYSESNVQNSICVLHFGHKAMISGQV